MRSARIRGEQEGRTRDDGSRTSLRTVDGYALGDPRVIPGPTRAMCLCRVLVLDQDEVLLACERVVETRRLELLTLSLQRRCSSS
jgi:hypothetical protein